MIRVFPRKTSFTPTDSLAFVGDPPLFRPPDDDVRVSVCFSWDIAEGKRLQKAWGDFYTNVTLGGPAFDDPGDEFEPGMFVKHGVTITSRGCPKVCSYCLVPRREGPTWELKIQEGWIVQDNNLLACSRGHVEAVFEMLSRQRKGAIFSGGLDATLFQPWHLDLIQALPRLGELWFACDSHSALKPLKHVALMIQGIPEKKKRCYVLIGMETIQEAERRLERVYELGFLPFAQLFRPADSCRSTIIYEQNWKALARKWSRPTAYRGRKEAPR